MFEGGEYKLIGENSVQSLWESLTHIHKSGNIYEDIDLIESFYKGGK